jgi:magnesium-transporting ATPase (P-type)
MYFHFEILRMLQKTLIKYDNDIYDQELKKPTLARTSELPDELGQVNFILSDKTGTMTQNNMILHQISVDDKMYKIEDIFSYFKIKYNFQHEKSFSSSSSSSAHTSSLGEEIENNQAEDREELERLKSENSSLISDPCLKIISTNDQNPKISTTLNNNNCSFIENEEVLLRQKLRSNSIQQSMVEREEKIIDFFRMVNICSSLVIDQSKDLSKQAKRKRKDSTDSIRFQVF